MRKPARLSLPQEHGALVVLLAAAVVAAALAPYPALASAVMALFLLAFLARGPLERRLRGFRPRRLDNPATAFYGVVAAASIGVLAIGAPAPEGGWMAGPLLAAATAVSASAFLIGGGIAQKLRVHRSVWVELLGMAACGLSAGLALVAGGVAASEAAVVATALSSYGVASVLSVRGLLRAGGATFPLQLAALVILGGGAAVAGWFEPLLAAAFAGRFVHLIYRASRPAARPAPYRVAAVETAQLTLFAVLLLLAMHLG